MAVSQKKRIVHNGEGDIFARFKESLVLVLRFTVRTLLLDQYSTSGSICSGKVDLGDQFSDNFNPPRTIFLPEQIFRDSSIHNIYFAH